MVKKPRTRVAATLAQSTQNQVPSFRRSAISLAVAAALPGMAMLPAQVMAQDDQSREAVVEEVTVTGFRGSLRNSMGLKKSSKSIVEAISSEDIGKLPDVSIAESLARLPGLTAQRLNGRGQVISVRGLSPDFTTALLNGREQVSTGDNRGVEFDQYPSELLSSVVVYKTPDAQLIGQGLAGTADLRTIRPLSHGRQTISGNVRYEWTDIGSLNAGSPDDGVRYSASYIDQFANDTVGIALGFAHLDNPSQEERYNSWGYPTIGAGEAIIGGAKPYVRSTDLSRDGIIGVLEYDPTDRVSTALDVYYSEFDEQQFLRGIELPLQWSSAQIQPGYTITDGLVTEGQFNGVKGVMRNDVTARQSELLAVGFNVEFEMNENWIGELDLSTSSVDREDQILETYSGTGTAGSGAEDSLGFTLGGDTGAVFNPALDYTDPNLIMLTSPQGWGGDIVPGGQVGYNNLPTIEDTLNQIGISAERQMDGAISSMKFGVNYSTREKDKVVNEFFLALASGATEAPLPNTLGVTDLSFLGIPGMISYDPLAAIANGVYTLSPNPNGDVAVKDWSVEEDVSIAYAMFDIDAEWGSIPVTGNFGLQVINVDQSSSAIGADDSSGTLVAVPITDGKDYTEVLPSLNLQFEVADEHYLRFAVARTLARPRMDELRASQEWTYDPSRAASNNINAGPWGGEGGNPQLDPWIANGVDLSYETYFQDGIGYLSLALFYKDLESYIVKADIVRDFTNFPIGGGPEPVLRQGLVSGFQNGEGGRISGVEFALSGTGELWTPALQNFGWLLNASWTDSDIQSDSGNPSQPLPGLSEQVFNGTLFYENESFSARVSARYRSEFLGEVGGFGGGREFRSIQEETIIDAQMSYAFGGRLEGLTLLLQGFNLSDEPLTTFTNDDARFIIDYQRYGRAFMVGASYTYE